MSDEIKLPDFRLDGKRAIVTGGTKGLGYAIAVTMARYGAAVLLTSRTAGDVAECERKLRDMGCKCLGVTADSSRREDIDRVVRIAQEAFGGVDILVNNAGIGGKTAPALEQSEEDFMRVIDVNLKGVFLFAKAAASQMIRQRTGGKIINMSSAAGLIGEKNVAPYSAAKAGVIGMTKTMAKEWARYGITVNAVCPGYVVTSINREVFADPEAKKRIERRNPLRRMGTEEEIAGPVLALCSGCFDYMTGAVISIDGGQTIGG